MMHYDVPNLTTFDLTLAPFLHVALDTRDQRTKTFVGIWPLLHGQSDPLSHFFAIIHFSATIALDNGNVEQFHFLDCRKTLAAGVTLSPSPNRQPIWCDARINNFRFCLARRTQHRTTCALTTSRIHLLTNERRNINL